MSSATASATLDDGFGDELAVFRAVADPARRAILDLLARGGQAVTELLQHFSFSQPALSKHLRVLREAGLVAAEKRGRARIYTLQAAPLKRVHDWVGHYERFWTERLDRLGALLDRLDDEERPRS